MLIKRYVNRLILSRMHKAGLELSQLDEALSAAMADLKGHDYALNHREILNAVFSYHKGGALLDLGGRGNIYHLILKHLGMRVEVLDFAFNEVLKAHLESLGIIFTYGDLYTSSFGSGKYDVVSSFECFEHLPHSPKPIVDKAYDALKTGGSLALSVPNIVRFEQRWRVFIGDTPYEKYSYFYNSGDYFPGHHREMTVAEVKYVFAQTKLQLEDLFTTDMTMQSAKKRSGLKKLANTINYQYLLTDRIMPPNLRKHVWGKGRKI